MMMTRLKPVSAPQPSRVVYGRRAVVEAVRGRRRVHRIIGTSRALKDVEAQIAGFNGLLEVVDSESCRILCGSDDHQGIVAEADSYPYVSVEELVSAAGSIEGDLTKIPLIFCLDQITDPQNLGAIARVCDATGSLGMIIPKHGSATISGAAVKASAGALEHVKVALCTNLADTIDHLKDKGFWVYGASEHSELPYTQADMTDHSVLVLGSEGSGIRPRVREKCDQLISIPMAGAVSSLNVSTGSAVLAFEVVRQRRQ